MEIVVELVIQVIGEIILEGVFEGLGWMLERRLGRLALGVVLGAGGGLLWSVVLGHTGPPVIGSLVVGAQAGLIPLLQERELVGRRMPRDVLTDLALIGAATVAARWAGWAIDG